MKQLSRWANANPNKSRLIIVLCHFLIVINAICCGVLLFLFSVEESNWLLIGAANIFFLVYILYPKRSIDKNEYRLSYARRKTHDFSLMILCSIVISLGVNNFLIQNNREINLLPEPTARFMVFNPASETEITNRKNLKSALKEKVKSLKKQVKLELRELKKKTDRKDGKTGTILLQFLLMFLTLAIAFILGFIVALFACDLSCTGQGTLALVVLIVGWGGILWLSVIAIKAILEKIRPGILD